MIADKKKREDGDSDQFNDLINVDWWWNAMAYQVY
jgi:hypothetical protein